MILTFMGHSPEPREAEITLRVWLLRDRSGAVLRCEWRYRRSHNRSWGIGSVSLIADLLATPVSAGTGGSLPILNGGGRSAISRSAARAIGTVHGATQPLAANSSWRSTPARVVGFIAATRS